MKVAVGMIVFNGNYVLRETLESVYPYVDQILIAEGPVTFWQEQGYKTSDDGTNDIIDNFPDPDDKIKIVHGQFSEKDDQCNAYMQHLDEDIDYIWNVDSDEVFKPEDIELLFQILNSNLIAEKPFTSVGFKSVTFYGGFDDVLGGFEEGAEFIRMRKVYPGSYWSTHRPPTVAHKIHSPHPERHLDFNTLADAYGIRMYHYSYVFPDQVSQKVKYYKEKISKNNCIDNYFESIYLPWVYNQNRNSIESAHRGVHEFKPEYRGDCYTKPFAGTHPEVVQKNISELKEKFQRQLLQYDL